MDSLIAALQEMTLRDVVSQCCSVAMIFGGVMPYIPQYREIKKTQSADGFSTFVCLALLIANTLRIMFWFGHPFEMPLLIQSIFMNAAMLAMIHLCVHTRNLSIIIPGPARTFAEETAELMSVKPSSSPPPPPSACHTLWDMDWKFFWAWTDFLSYLEFMATFTVCVASVMYIFMNVAIIVEGIGFLALLTEALLGTPQFYKNYRNQSTSGMSKNMVIMWTCGDIFKTAYFIFRVAPLQFWLCGILQVSIDLAILAQILYYRFTPAKVLKRSVHTS